MSFRSDARHWKPNILPAFVVAALFSFLIYAVYSKTLKHPDAIAWSPWAFSEWLINYSGGFVRRGLAGQLILGSIDGNSAAPMVNRIVFGSFLLLCVLVGLLFVLSERRGAWTRLLAVLVPGGIYNMVMGNEFFFRKEMAFHSLLAWLAVLHVLALHREARSWRLACGIAFALSAVIGATVLSFLHEGFFFLTAGPAALLGYSLLARLGIRRKLPLTLAFLAWCAGLFLVSSLFKGNTDMAAQIWGSLSATDRGLISRDGTLAGGISAIGDSIANALKLVLLTLSSGNAWYWVFIVAVSAAYCLGLAEVERRDSNGGGMQASDALLLYAVLFACVVPLFILGWDWGRWISSVNMSFVTLFFAGVTLPRLTRLSPFLPDAGGKAVLQGWLRSRWLVLLMVLFGLTFKLPECCISGTGAPFFHVKDLGRP